MYYFEFSPAPTAVACRRKAGGRLFPNTVCQYPVFSVRINRVT